jgi:hypothetical protein
LHLHDRSKEHGAFATPSRRILSVAPFAEASAQSAPTPAESERPLNRHVSHVSVLSMMGWHRPRGSVVGFSASPGWEYLVFVSAVKAGCAVAARFASLTLTPVPPTKCGPVIE